MPECLTHPRDEQRPRGLSILWTVLFAGPRSRLGKAVFCDPAQRERIPLPSQGLQLYTENLGNFELKETFGIIYF